MFDSLNTYLNYDSSLAYGTKRNPHILFSDYSREREIDEKNLISEQTPILKISPTALPPKCIFGILMVKYCFFSANQISLLRILMDSYVVAGHVTAVKFNVCVLVLKKFTGRIIFK